MSADRGWPPGFDPAEAHMHIEAIRVIPAEADLLWAWLVRPYRWHEYYRFVADMDLGGGRELALGTEFRWRTLGTRVVTRVEEFVPARRIAWRGGGGGVDAYHAFDLEPGPGGCRVTSEETQRGTLPRLFGPVLRHAFNAVHAHWLAGLERIAARGLPDDSG